MRKCHHSEIWSRSLCLSLAICLSGCDHDDNRNAVEKSEACEKMVYRSRLKPGPLSRPLVSIKSLSYNAGKLHEYMIRNGRDAFTIQPKHHMCLEPL